MLSNVEEQQNNLSYKFIEISTGIRIGDVGQPNNIVPLPVIVVAVFTFLANAIFTRMFAVMTFRASKIIFTLSEL